MKTTIDLRAADLCVYPAATDSEGRIHLDMNDCEGGDLCLVLDRQAAVDIVGSLQSALKGDRNATNDKP